jgi:hypothetical protein
MVVHRSAEREGGLVNAFAASYGWQAIPSPKKKVEEKEESGRSRKASSKCV